MAMVLSGTKDLKIQKIGRWRSLAFMEYIRDQIESFTLGVSQGMCWSAVNMRTLTLLL